MWREVFKTIWILTTIIWIIAGESCALTPEQPSIKGLPYSWEELLQLRVCMPGVMKPSVSLRPEIRQRKRGRSGGVRSCLRKRPFRPPLPSIILADILHAKCRADRPFREGGILALTETWLNADAEVHLDSFTIFKADRTRESGKERGGRVCCMSTRDGATTSPCMARYAH